MPVFCKNMGNVTKKLAVSRRSSVTLDLLQGPMYVLRTQQSYFPRFILLKRKGFSFLHFYCQINLPLCNEELPCAGTGTGCTRECLSRSTSRWYHYPPSTPAGTARCSCMGCRGPIYATQATPLRSLHFGRHWRHSG